VEGAVRSHALQRSFTTGIAFWSPKFGPPVDANPVEFGFHLKSELARSMAATSRPGVLSPKGPRLQANPVAATLVRMARFTRTRRLFRELTVRYD